MAHQSSNHIYIYIHMQIKRCIDIFTHTHISTCALFYIYKYIHDLIYARLHCIDSPQRYNIFIYICIYVCVYIYTYIQAHVWDLLVNKTPVGGYHLRIIRKKCHHHSRTAACTSLMSVRLDGPSWQIGGRDVNAGRDSSAASLH